MTNQMGVPHDLRHPHILLSGPFLMNLGLSAYIERLEEFPQ